MGFAEGTVVPIARTRGEIEALVEKYGASRFASGWTDNGVAGISFAIKGRMVRFELTLPTMGEAAKKAPRGNRYYATDSQKKKWIDGEGRRRWRCLLLAIKAKLEIVETGIATFEQEFLGHIVTASNQTIYEALKMQESGQRLLPPLEASP